MKSIYVCMNTDLPPTDEPMEKLIATAKEITFIRTQLPRQAVLDVCPVCCKPVIIRHGHAVCTSALCRQRVLEGCCGE